MMRFRRSTLPERGSRAWAYPSRLSSPIRGLSFSVSSFTSNGRRPSIGGKRRVRTLKTYKPKS